jgi:hypothetical protein
MRFKEFKKPLVEFAQEDFVLPEIDIIGPTDPETAAINKQNALLLLQMEPDSSSMKEIQQLLAQYSANSDNELQPTAEPVPAAVPAAVPADQAQPEEPEVDVANPDEIEDDDLEEDLTEGKKAIDIGSRVALLNENDPEQAELLARIEAILESKKIEPVITKIIQDKFTFHLPDIIETFRNAIISVKVSIAEKVKFLASCKKGFFDMSSVKTSPQGNLYSGIPGAIFNAIKDPLFRIEFGTGGNKIGKGEALLAIIGKGAFKGERGDLQITVDGKTEELEIKASSGDKGPTGAVLVALGKGESEDGKRSKESAYGANTEAGKTFKALISKAYSTRTAPIKPDQVPNSINSISIAKFFNPFILRNPARGPATINAIKESYKIIFKKQKEQTFFDQMDAALDENGINADTLVKIVRAMEFDYYKGVIKHDAILFMNGTTGTYRYIDSGEMLLSQIATSSKGANLYSTGVIDFSGSYGNGFGKIFTK